MAEQANQKADPEARQESHDPERRAALRKLAAGLGLVAGSSLLPERWTKPIVETIVSPAQAGLPSLPTPPTPP